jgi:hypothetical protein
MFRTDTDRKSYTCPACSNPEWALAGKSVVVDEATTRVLLAQNGVEWLGYSSKTTLFDGKSAFKLMQAFGESVFANTASSKTPTLTLHNKRIREPEQVIAEIENRVGRGEVVLSSCALCFEEMPSTKLVEACGRSGCSQLVDEDCLREWVRPLSLF